MAEETPERVLSGANTDGMLQSLTQGISLETTEHAKELVMAARGTSEEEDKALSGMLSKSNKPDIDEKPSVETEGKVAMAGGDHVKCNENIEQSQCTPKMSENCIQGKDVIESGAEKNNFDTNSNGQVDRESGFSAEIGKLPKHFKTPDNNCSDRSVNNELSDGAEKLPDELPATWANSGNVSSSEDEKLPELLSMKAEDTCSEIEDGEGRESLGDLYAGMDASGESKSMEEMPGAFPGNSRTNLLSGTGTEKCYPPGKVVDYESSSEDDQMAPSSSLSDVTSSASELSDVVVPSETSDVRNNEELDNGSMSMTGTRVDDIADDNALNAEASQEPEGKKAQVLERMSSVLSTGTQTSSEPDENIQQDQLAKDQILNTWNFEGLSSILTMKDNGSLKLPFYYQPQIVMHEQQPVLVLQPVRLSMSSPSSNGDVPVVGKGTVKATVPIILPLASLDIDKATKDAVLEEILDGDASEMSSTTSQGYSKYSLLQNEPSDVPQSLNTTQLGGFNDRGGETRSIGTDVPVSRRLAEEEKHLEGSKTDGLREWVPPAELDKAFSAAAEGAATSSTEPTATTLTFPRVSLPSTNPFARDLAAQQNGHSEVKVDDLSNLGLDKTMQQSLFGPPTSSNLSPGARPKQIKVNQEPTSIGNTTNPFTPDLMPKKRGRRQDQNINEHSTEVIVTADVHSSEVNRPLHRSPRRRLSSGSMVTLIETTYADTPPSSAELTPTPAAAGEPNKITQVKEDPKPPLRPPVGSKETQSNIKMIGNLKVVSFR